VAHTVLGLEVADDGLDGGPATEFALDLRRPPRFCPERKTLNFVIGRKCRAVFAERLRRRMKAGIVEEMLEPGAKVNGHCAPQWRSGERGGHLPSTGRDGRADRIAMGAGKTDQSSAANIHLAAAAKNSR
jgi:hypothetical protein